MLEWFNRKRPEKVPDAQEPPVGLDRNASVALGQLITITSLETSLLISNTWAGEVGESSMPWKQDFVIRCEILWFFLHMLSRYALATGGLQKRAELQDDITPTAIETIMTVSFDSSNAKPGFDSKEWLERMVESGIEEMNSAEIDYSSCTQLYSDSGSAPLDEQTVLGKLAARINRAISDDYNPVLRLLVWKTALEALATSRIKQQVELVCNA